MRKAFAIAFISLHLLSNTELSQVIRLPKLISHYFQHHRQNPGINFFDFLAMHYGGDDGTSADDDIDSQLPYHNTDHHCLFTVYSPMLAADFFFNGIDHGFSKYNSRPLDGIPSKHVLLLLRPPWQA